MNQERRKKPAFPPWREYQMRTKKLITSLTNHVNSLKIVDEKSPS